MTDRTAELFAIAEARWKLRGRPPGVRPRPTKTAFGKSALHLGRALQATEKRTARLGKLATKSSLFDDPAAEIGEISVAVRQELAGSGSALEMLKASNRQRGRQFAEHTNAVIAWLGMQMSEVTNDFQAALKQREATISNKESRAARLGVAGVGSPFGSNAMPPSCGGGRSATGSTSSGSSSLVKQQLLPVVGGVRQRRPLGGGAGRGQPPLPGTPPSAPHTPVGPGAGRPQQQQQQQHHRAYHDVAGFGSPAESWEGDGVDTPEQLEQQFWTPRSQRHRAQEVSQMHKTLAELSTMFGRFSTIVSEQGESIKSIEDNVEAADMSIDLAHTELTKYQKLIKGNRGLILKTFFVLFFLVIVYGTVSR